MERDFTDEFSDNELSFLESTRYDQNFLRYDEYVSQNWSGVVRSTKPLVEVGTQTEFHERVVKPLRSGLRNFDNSIKTVLVLSCSNVRITTEQSCKDFQTTFKFFYGIKYVQRMLVQNQLWKNHEKHSTIGTIPKCLAVCKNYCWHKASFRYSTRKELCFSNLGSIIWWVSNNTSFW